MGAVGAHGRAGTPRHDLRCTLGRLSWCSGGWGACGQIGQDEGARWGSWLRAGGQGEGHQGLRQDRGRMAASLVLPLPGGRTGTSFGLWGSQNLKCEEPLGTCPQRRRGRWGRWGSGQPEPRGMSCWRGRGWRGGCGSRWRCGRLSARPPPSPRAWMLGMKYDGHPFRRVTEFPQTEETPGVRN